MTDIKVTGDVPIFGTGPCMIQWYSMQEEEPRREKHDEEDHQINLRWKTFTLTHKFVGFKDIAECPSCFAKLAFVGHDD